MSECRPITDAVARLKEYDELHGIVMQAAKICQEGDAALRFSTLWELLALGYTAGHGDAIEELYQRMMANRSDL